jgi:hypothetical protein
MLEIVQGEHLTLDNLEKLRKAIIKMDLSAKKLEDFARWIRDRMKVIERSMARQFYVGQIVTFETNRRSGPLHGTVLGRITKVNQNTVSLIPMEINGHPLPANSRGWRVPLSMLTAID